jgi:hypothetical protein
LEGAGCSGISQYLVDSYIASVLHNQSVVSQSPAAAAEVAQSDSLHRHLCSSVISVRPEWTYGFLCLLLLFISAYLCLIWLSALLFPLLFLFLTFPLLFIISTNSVVSIYISSHLSRTLSFSLRISCKVRVDLSASLCNIFDLGSPASPVSVFRLESGRSRPNRMGIMK